MLLTSIYSACSVALGRVGNFHLPLTVVRRCFPPASEKFCIDCRGSSVGVRVCLYKAFTVIAYRGNEIYSLLEVAFTSSPEAKQPWPRRSKNYCWDQSNLQNHWQNGLVKV